MEPHHVVGGTLVAKDPHRFDPLWMSDSTVRFIHSCIPGLQPEDTCEVRCKLPFLGDPVMGRCPADNTAPWIRREADRIQHVVAHRAASWGFLCKRHQHGTRKNETL